MLNDLLVEHVTKSTCQNLRTWLSEQHSYLLEDFATRAELLTDLQSNKLPADNR